MCVSPGSVLAAGSSLYSGYAAKVQGKAQYRYALQNAQLEQQLALDDETISRRETRSVVGSQIAEAAAAGIDPNSVSQLAILEDTVRRGERNALAIRAGGQQRARQYQTEGILAKARGKSALVGGALSAAGQLLQGASQAGSASSQLKIAGAG